METSSDGPDLPLQLYAALVPLLGLVHSARTMSPGKIGILRQVSSAGHCSAAQLSQTLSISQQGISMASKDLEAAGYLSRQRDETDRRKIWFSLTPEGEAKLAAESRRGRDALMSAITASLTDDERKLVRAAIPALEKIKSGIAQ